MSSSRLDVRDSRTCINYLMIYRGVGTTGPIGAVIPVGIIPCGHSTYGQKTWPGAVPCTFALG